MGRRCGGLSLRGGIVGSADRRAGSGTFVDVRVGNNRRGPLFQTCARRGAPCRSGEARLCGLGGAIACTSCDSAYFSFLPVCGVGDRGGWLGGGAGKAIARGRNFRIDAGAIRFLWDAAFRTRNCAYTSESIFHRETRACGLGFGRRRCGYHQPCSASICTLCRLLASGIRICAAVSDFCRVAGGDIQRESELAERAGVWRGLAWWSGPALANRANFYANRVSEQGISCTGDRVRGDGVVVAARPLTRRNRPTVARRFYGWPWLKPRLDEPKQPQLQFCT